MQSGYALQLTERGYKKETISLITLGTLPFDLSFAIICGYVCKKHFELFPFIAGITARFLIGIPLNIYLYNNPVIHNDLINHIIVVINQVTSVIERGCYYTCVLALLNRVSDPAIGGTT